MLGLSRALPTSTWCQVVLEIAPGQISALSSQPGNAIYSSFRNRVIHLCCGMCQTSQNWTSKFNFLVCSCWHWWAFVLLLSLGHNEECDYDQEWANGPVEGLAFISVHIYLEISTDFLKSLIYVVTLHFRNSSFIGSSWYPSVLLDMSGAKILGLQERKREPFHWAVLTDCVNLVINGMRKQEECLSLPKRKKKPNPQNLGAGWFYFQLKGSDFVSEEWF